MSDQWFLFEGIEELPSPGLVFYRERIEENISRMLKLAGSAEAVRPHVKTHKCAEIVRLHLERGIRKFKCATIAELEMAAEAGARDLLLAYQPVGPNADRLVALQQAFPETRFSAVLDDWGAAERLAAGFAKTGKRLPVLVDLDVGMHRTGVAPGEAAVDLCRRILALSGVQLEGIHAYDGHIHQTDLKEREAACNAAFAHVEKLRRHLEDLGLKEPRVVAGGTPTFPLHARRGSVESSPGTYVLWDAGYGKSMPDLPFLPAATLITRVISKPGPGRVCLDLGHKAVAAEQPPPRVQFLTLPDAKELMQSEEHLVVETARAGDLQVGDVLFAVPRHICPTVALHSRAAVVERGKRTAFWKIPARERVLHY